MRNLRKYALSTMTQQIECKKKFSKAIKRLNFLKNGRISILLKQKNLGEHFETPTRH